MTTAGDGAVPPVSSGHVLVLVHVHERRRLEASASAPAVHPRGPRARPHPGDIVVLDGPWIHRVAGVAEALADLGDTSLYLPPHSPELDPIEEVWSWLETAMREAAPRRIGRLRKAIDKIRHSLSAESCAAWIRHSGYTVAST